MAFVLAPKTSFTAPVTLSIPADGGKFNKVTFLVAFKLLSASQVKDLRERVQASHRQLLAAVEQYKAQQEADPTQTPGPLPSPSFTDIDVAHEVLAGFGRDLTTPEGQPVEFTPENVGKLLEINGAAEAIVSSFYKHHFEAPAKN